MNAYQRDVGSTLKEVERELGDPVAVINRAPNTKELPCIPSFEQRSTLIEIGGNPVVIDLALLFRRELFVTADSMEVTADSTLLTADDFTPVPGSGELLEFLGRDYKVIAIGWAPAKTHLRFELAEPNSGQ